MQYLKSTISTFNGANPILTTGIEVALPIVFPVLSVVHLVIDLLDSL